MRGGLKPRLHFPIIIIDKKGSITVSNREDVMFVRWTKSLAKDVAYYTNLKLIDARGGWYKIVRVDILGYANFFLGFDIFFEQKVIADTHVELIEQLSLEALKAVITDSIKVDNDYFASAGIDDKKLIEEVNSGRDIHEVIRILSAAYNL